MSRNSFDSDNINISGLQRKQVTKEDFTKDGYYVVKGALEYESAPNEHTWKYSRTSFDKTYQKDLYATLTYEVGSQQRTCLSVLRQRIWQQQSTYTST